MITLKTFVFTVVVLCAITYTPSAAAEAKQKKESKKPVMVSEPVSYDPASHRADCLKRRSLKTCERLIEIQKNINDILKQTVPLQLQ
jgi:hypothetical protein